MTHSPRRPATVRITAEADNDLDRYASLTDRFYRAIRTLADRPDRGHPLTGRLRECRSLELSRLGGGFRAVYVWERERNIVTVFAIGPHATVYDTAAQRFPPPQPEK